jgi:RHS repeat-associated protein
MRQRVLAVALLLIVAASQAVAAPAGQQQFIVKTKHVITPPHTKAAPSVQDFVRAGGGHVDYEWRDRLVVTIPDAAVQALMQHPAVDFVQKVASGIPEGGSAAAEGVDPVVTNSTFRPAPKTLPPWTSGTYSYDGEGNITAIGLNAYSYDAFSRLVTSTTNGIPETYTYDRYGNLTQKRTGTGSTALTVQSDVDDGNHLSGHCYDTAGNLTDDAGVNCPTATETHSFDALNMMTMKWNHSASTKEYYIYNANDERIAVIPCSGTVCTEQITFSFRDESGKVLRQFEVPYQQFDSPWTWVEDYVYRDGVLFAAERMPAQGGRRHFHVDHLGTPRLITDSSGHRISEHDYFPFGVEATPLRQDTVPPNNFNREEPMKFTGHERDFTVGTSFENSNYIDYMHARSTVPQWGRFLSVDPVLDQKRAAKIPQAWNRYAYVESNPLNRTDPDGREIYFQTHYVVRVEPEPGVGETGINHNSIRVEPVDQARWAKDPHFNNVNPETGRHYMTLGAGPARSVGSIIGFGGRLMADFNRAGDVDLKSKNSVVKMDLKGRNENEVISSLISAQNVFMQKSNLPYELFPSATSNSYNSNSYAAGLTKFVGLDVPRIGNSPGLDKPIPGKEFRP